MEGWWWVWCGVVLIAFRGGVLTLARCGGSLDVFIYLLARYCRFASLLITYYTGCLLLYLRLLLSASAFIEHIGFLFDLLL